MEYWGIDLHQDKTDICIQDNEGEVVERTTVQTTRQALTRNSSNDREMRVIMEAGLLIPSGAFSFSVIGASVLVALLIFSACYREVSEDSLFQSTVSNGPWAVDGVILGESAKACVAKLGEPDRRRDGGYGLTVLQWTQRRQATVIIDAVGRVIEISGANLTDRSGKAVVWSSAAENEVRAILPSARVEKSYRPKGGVISLGRTHVGTSYVVSDDLGSYTVVFNEGNMSNVLARPSHR